MYHGRYTPESVDRMPVDEIRWHATKLKEQLEAEAKAKKEAMEKAKARQRSVRRPPPPRRR